MSTITTYEDALNQLAKTKRRPKYGNKKTEIITDGQSIIYDSKREAKVAHDLRMRELAHEITDLKRQVAFRFELNGILICIYRPDFVYMENGKQVVVDVKSVSTRQNPVFRIKYKMMKAFFGIDVVEVL